jgi:hypothetical protein
MRASRQRKNHFPGTLISADSDVCSFKAIFRWQADSLTSSVFEELGGLRHSESSRKVSMYRHIVQDASSF